jgi:hypothetical protein
MVTAGTVMAVVAMEVVSVTTTPEDGPAVMVVGSHGTVSVRVAMMVVTGTEEAGGRTTVVGMAEMIGPGLA